MPGKSSNDLDSLKENVDYYIDHVTGYLVFTKEYHLKRGYCCGSGCKHCPWIDEKSNPSANATS